MAGLSLSLLPPGMRTGPGNQAPQTVPATNSGDPSGGLLPEYNPNGMGMTGSGTNLPPNYIPELTNLYNQQAQTAQNYNANIPGLARQLYNNSSTQTNRQLQQGLKQVRSDYNSRGLLNSGMEQGGEYAQTANAASTNASNQAAINNQVYQTGQQLNNQAFGTASTIANSGYNYMPTYLSGLANTIQASQQQNAANTQVISNLFGGVGNVAGTLAGSNTASSSNPYSNVQPQTNSYYGQTPAYNTTNVSNIS